MTAWTTSGTLCFEYFRKTGERLDEKNDQRYLTLKIPNREARYIFRTKVLGWFHEQVKSRDQHRLFHAFLERDAGVVREEIEDMLMQTISFYDAYESFYHGFLVGILYGIAFFGKDCEVRISEMEV